VAAPPPLLGPAPGQGETLRLDPLSKLIDPLLRQRERGRSRPSRTSEADDLLDFLFGN